MKHAAPWLAAGLVGGLASMVPHAHAAPPSEPEALECSPRPAQRVDRAICAEAALLEADRNLAAITRELGDRMAEPAPLWAAQQDWKQRRNRMCAPRYTAECLSIAYAEREAYLRAQLAAMPPLAPSPPMAALSAPAPAPAPA
ncbi:hypothetical protein HMPREF9946_01532, partial [Acetobacteraceae bacterium AT-5844]